MCIIFVYLSRVEQCWGGRMVLCGVSVEQCGVGEWCCVESVLCSVGDRMVLCGVSVVKCGVTGWCCVE